MSADIELPTAELLLDTRTPAELTLSSDGSRMTFALHATVADVGPFVPSNLYVTGSERGAKPERLTSGACADVAPAAPRLIASIPIEPVPA